jgi:hypothetical protein
MHEAIRVTFRLPRPYELALRKLRASDPSVRSRTDAILRAIHAGLAALKASAPAQPGSRK